MQNHMYIMKVYVMRLYIYRDRAGAGGTHTHVYFIKKHISLKRLSLAQKAQAAAVLFFFFHAPAAPPGRYDYMRMLTLLLTYIN